MSSEFETSRVVTFKADPRDSSTSLGMTIFAALDVYHDHTPRSATMNMAIDEALLENATNPAIRFYRWQSPALSFGYFGRFADVASHQGERDLVRRWTGGGIVLHGEDLTYSIVILASDAAFAESSTSIYETIHQGLCHALNTIGKCAAVAGGIDPGHTKIAMRSAVSDAGYNCFANPVRADVMINGRKIAGAAQRRTRGGLLQQGSIQGIELQDNLTERFAQALSANRKERELDEDILNRARQLAERKYGTESWLRMR
jgi:lipoyl(octanoyl) transferase